MDALKLAQQPPELFARHGPLARHVIRITPECQRARRVADALDVKACDLFFEAAFFQQHVFRADIHIVEIGLHPFFAVEKFRRFSLLEAFGGARYQHRADTAHARAEAHIGQHYLGHGGVRLKHLHAVDAIAVTIGRGAGGEIGHRAARIRLGHADADHRFAAQNVVEITLFLIRRAVLGQYAHRAEVARLNHIRAARAGFRHRFNREYRVHQRTALTAVGFGKRNAHQALFGHEFGHIPRMLGLVRSRQRAGLQMLMRKAADGIAKLLLFGGEFEVHCLGRKWGE